MILLTSLLVIALCYTFYAIGERQARRNSEKETRRKLRNE